MNDDFCFICVSSWLIRTKNSETMCSLKYFINLWFPFLSVKYNSNFTSFSMFFVVVEIPCSKNGNILNHWKLNFSMVVIRKKMLDFFVAVVVKSQKNTLAEEKAKKCGKYFDQVTSYVVVDSVCLYVWPLLDQLKENLVPKLVIGINT